MQAFLWDLHTAVVRCGVGQDTLLLIAALPSLIMALLTRQENGTCLSCAALHAAPLSPPYFRGPQ